MTPIPLGILASSLSSTASFELIETINLSSNTQQITFSNIPQDYEYLQIRTSVRISMTSSVVDNLFLRFNNNSNSSYFMHYMATKGSGVITYYNTNALSSISMYNSAVSTWDSNSTGMSVIDIPNYTDNTYKKMSYKSTAINSAERSVAFGAGSINYSGPITAVTILNNNWNMMAGSRFSIYGVKS